MNPIQHLFERINQQNLWHGNLSLHRNEYLKVEGSIDTRVFYVLQGSLRVFVVDGFEEHTIRFGYNGDFITALDSFIEEQPSELYIQAIKKSELKVILKKSFMDLIESDPALLQFWVKILGQLICRQMERERDLLTASPMERYKRVLARSPQLFQEIPHKYIASYLRMTPETLSRLKKS